MENKSKLPFIGLAIALAIYFMFRSPVALPEFAKRAPHDQSKVKSDWDAYLRKTKDALEEKQRAESDKRQSQEAEARRVEAARHDMQQALDAQAAAMASQLNLKPHPDLPGQDTGRVEPVLTSSLTAKPVAPTAALTAPAQPVNNQVTSTTAAAPVSMAPAPVITPNQPQALLEKSPMSAESNAHARENAPSMPANLSIVYQTPTARFLYLRIGDSVARFHVDANLGDSELDTVVAALGKACVKAPAADETCDPLKRTSLEVDGGFFADVKLSETDHWSKAQTATGTLWKLACYGGGDDCFLAGTDVRHFVLTTRASTSEGRILAHGFESQAAAATGSTGAVKPRLPASVHPKSLSRVYLTRTNKEPILLQAKGTLK